ncbi:sigma-70 family RNA polymerase sigma factor [Polaromonas sp. LjRoot131]|uniref:sigma-70 family RNA polymerase sigma factor n=1 Tax=Polaromonas sp. LjRoot131 TaxID=3342262 RepID=UPI003ECEFE56
MPSAPPSDDAAEDSDESLMLRYAAGEIAAFDALYARHELGVWRYVFRSVRVQAVADDLLQDVWFAVARSAPTYKVSARFKTWLFTMAHNRLIDYFRTARHHVSLDGNGGDDGEGGESPGLGDTLAADSGFGPLRRLESSEQAAALIAAVERLPREQREAFLLQAEAGLSVEEIAAATGVNFETAKSRLRYARNSLRQQLQEFA